MTRTRKRRMMNQINVVPYIDVMLVLLVIFMVTAPLKNPGVVDLPNADKTDQLKQKNTALVVSVKLDNIIELDNKKMDKADLLLAIKNAHQQDPERPVVIAADKNVKYGDVTSVMNLVKQNGVQKVGLYFNPAEK